MSTHSLDQLRTELTRINVDLTSLEDQFSPLEEQVKALKKEKNAKAKAVRKYMESNDLTTLELCGTRYTLEDETDTKCTITRMLATLPEDVVEEYIQANTITEPKFKKIVIPPSYE
jgi:predicted  nucleic acid-binding Zn-ribbon protein